MYFSLSLVVSIAVVCSPRLLRKSNKIPLTSSIKLKSLVYFITAILSLNSYRASFQAVATAVDAYIISEALLAEIVRSKKLTAHLTLLLSFFTHISMD